MRLSLTKGFLTLVLACWGIVCSADSLFENSGEHVPEGVCSFESPELCPGVPGYIIKNDLENGPCGSNVRGLCADVAPGEGRLAHCLRNFSTELDLGCSLWGAKVGLNFNGGTPIAPAKQVAPPDDFTHYYGETVTGKVQPPLNCFGTEWFMNSACRVETPPEP